MARKSETITIAQEGRDYGKVFLLTEMPAAQAEKWATKALLALAKSGADLPQDVEGTGMAGVAVMGVKAFAGVTFSDAEPLMDEMLKCIKFVPEPSKPQIVRALVMDGISDDIEEVSTIIRLRMEVLQLHVGFSISGALSKLKAKASAAIG